MRTPATAGVVPRRVLATRNRGWARALAHWLATLGLRPNVVSVAGVAFAAAAGAMFYLSAVLPQEDRIALLVAAAACVQIRLLCNLLDGLLAVEEGLKTATGDVFNDLPDRVEDVLILVGAGYAASDVPFAETLGWMAAISALLTAYVRVLGGSLGLTQHFVGPMAKQHRMFTLTVATLLAAGECYLHMPPRAIAAGLALIAVGSLLTAARRTRRILVEAGAR